MFNDNDADNDEEDDKDNDEENYEEKDEENDEDTCRGRQEEAEIVCDNALMMIIMIKIVEPKTARSKLLR